MPETPLRLFETYFTPININRITLDVMRRNTCGHLRSYKLCCSHLLTLVLRSRIFLPRRWRRYVPPKRRFTEDLQGATSQKTAFFIVTDVKTSNLTKFRCVIIIINININFHENPSNERKD
jgi:hypothetical protein